MRRLHPDSIIGWTIVVLIAVLSVSQIVTIGIINSMRSDTLEVVEHFHFAERIADIVELIDAVPPQIRSELLAHMASDTLSVSWEREASVSAGSSEGWREVLFDDVVGAALWQEPKRQHRVALLPASEVIFVPGSDGVRRSLDLSTGTGRIIERTLSRHRAGRVLLTSISLSDGTWLNFQVPMADPPAAQGMASLLAIACSGLLILVLSVWAVRRLTRPLTVLAKAAEQLGEDVNAAPLPVSGSREMRQAARAFNTMQERIRRFVIDRIQLIAAISHDLRTPITRLRLRAEFADNEETRAKIRQDLAEMEAMIETTLSFAREEASPEPRTQVDLVSLVESVCEDLPNVTVRIGEGVPQRLPFECQPLAMRRCIGNLVGNAIKYGHRADLTLMAAPDSIRITVDDEGPGIAAEDRDRVFEPFLRLDASRNRETGGVGLGLTIARSVARAHGGDVELANRAQGGLRATLTLRPRA